LRKVVLAFLLGATLACSQVIDATHLGEPVQLKGNWRFRAGDNPAWAAANFDDSGWRLVPTGKSWDQLGLQHVRGYVWYRTKVNLPQQHEPLKLLLSEFGPSEMYVDGRKLGTFGRFPPNALLLYPFPQAYPINANTTPISVAVRYWISPLFQHVDYIASEIVVGTPSEIKRQQDLASASTLVQRIPEFIVQIFQILICVGLLVLFYFQRDHLEYLWLAIALAFTLLNGVVEDVQKLTALSIAIADYLDLITYCFGAVSLIEFAFRFIGEPVSRWLRIYQLVLPLFILALPAFWAGWIPAVAVNVAIGIYRVPYWFLTPGVMIWRFFQGNREAGLLAIPLSLLMLDDMLVAFGWLLWELHLRSTSPHGLANLQLGAVTVSPVSLLSFLFLLCVAALILYRFQKIRTKQVRASAELDAARNMQEVMVPASVAIRGFEIETAYLPAQEVGGDFFQLFPRDNGSLLVVIGDVSGKGLRAAMLVSMILGLLRRSVEQSHSPAQILRDVNRLLFGHTDGKFATCCCALLGADGSLTAANAGHLSPYCDGHELELPGGLPLGLSADAEYEEVRFGLPCGKRLVFVSDGVVEARSKSGELYGFDRTRTISIQAVAKIAETARQFGQEDDITVLGIERQEAALA
jgi:hypothetical protein